MPEAGMGNRKRPGRFLIQRLRMSVYNFYMHIHNLYMSVYNL